LLLLIPLLTGGDELTAIEAQTTDGEFACGCEWRELAIGLFEEMLAGWFLPGIP
jgi:hypothetical protein